MGASRARVFLVLVLFMTALVWGTRTCLHHLNRFLDPPRPIQAVEFQRLDDERLVCTVLGVELVLAVPHNHSWWSVPDEPPPGQRY
ncbi:MAG: hypothetical protein AB1441_09285 [Bacillota bacterium]